MNRIANIILFVAISAFSLVAVEAGYRLYLENRLKRLAEAEAVEDPTPSFSFFAYPAPWRFDAAQGFAFNDGPWRSGKIKDGAFDGCDSATRGNRYGNVGRIVADYESAQIRILLLGSSYTLVAGAGGDYVNHVLQRRLSERLGKRVSVLNFSRDATGLLTSFDIATAKLGEVKPDIVVFAFNVTALAYQRHWRVLEPLAPGFWRLVFSLNPDPELRDRDRIVLQPHIITDQATVQWCERMERALADGDAETLTNDPVVRALVAANRRTRRDMTIPRFAVDHWTISRSFIYNAMAHSDPYYKIPVFKEKTVYGPHGFWSFAEDGTFLDAMRSLQKSGVPFVLVHIPTLSEMRAGPDGPFVYGVTALPADREEALAKSLEGLAGQEIRHLYAYYDARLKKDPVKLVYSEKNSHPSPLGVVAMGEALEALLLDLPKTREALGLPSKTAAAE